MKCINFDRNCIEILNNITLIFLIEITLFYIDISEHFFNTSCIHLLSKNIMHHIMCKLQLV